MSREARVQKIKLTKFCFEALKSEHYTNVKTSVCLSVTHIRQKGKVRKERKSDLRDLAGTDIVSTPAVGHRF